MPELAVGIRNLKAHLSEYIDRVKRGQTILVTERGRPVGRILPVGPEVDLPRRIEAMQEAGLLAWNGKRLGGIQPPAANRSGRLVSDLLTEMRE